MKSIKYNRQMIRNYEIRKIQSFLNINDSEL